MRKFAVFLLLSLAACSEQVEEAYPTWAEAQRAGAAERGWIPAFVPSSARDIRESHDLDSNRQTLQFTASPSDIPRMVEGLRPVSIGKEREVVELSRAHGFAAASETYVVCSNPVKGALVVDRESGRAVYTTAVRWADDECSGG